jgi:mono/diheme cytochrome c family protein
MTYFARILRRFLLRVAVLAFAALVGAALVISWAPAISPITPPERGSFAAAAVTRGATLAALGDCVVCHTAAGGRPYAGGRGVPTPFGTVFATNVTPDAATGIGTWSLAAFQRAMRDGIDREGRHLYPVLPYPHFVRATDDDIAAMYAFLMTRAPVAAATPANKLEFPFKYRPLIAGWNLLFLSPGEWKRDTSKDAEWNRGAYLVDAIGHCGACHTPHNSLGAEENTLALDGGDAEGWYAPSLRTGMPRQWSVDALATYLRTGLDNQHGVAAGPMASVTHQLAAVPDSDVHAIAAYIASLMPPVPANPPPPTPTPTPPVVDPAATAMFDGACGACHGADAPMTRGGAPSLALSTAVNAPTARNVIDVILHGLPWREGQAGPYMPAFSGALTDAQVETLAAYVRSHYSDQSPWRDITASIRAAKRQGDGS